MQERKEKKKYKKKNNFKINDIGVLGNNLYRNPKFRVNIH